MALTKRQVAFANSVLDRFNERMERINNMDPWFNHGEVGPTLVTVNARREALADLNSKLGLVHLIEEECDCGRCKPYVHAIAE